MKPFRLLTLLVCAFVCLPVSAQQAQATTAAARANQVVAGFTGGAVWTSGNSGISIWYFPVLGNLALTDLFALNSVALPSVDKEHAYFIWVYDWKIQSRSQSGTGAGKTTIAVVPAGTATIYYSSNPLGRDWHDLTQRGSWGTPVATFACSPTMFYSADAFQTADKFYISATLVRVQTAAMREKTFNLGDLIPHGMTCFSYGQQASSNQTGTCIAMGN